MIKTQPIALQLQELAMDSGTHLPDLLRRALLVATKLNLTESKNWIMDELNGYKDIERLPGYRRISGQLKIHNPFYGLTPFVISDTKLADAVRQVIVSESVESLQHLVREGSNADTLAFPFSPEQEAILMRMQGGFDPLQPTREVGKSQIAAILEKIRTRILDWALSLEAEGILGEGVTFSKEEKERAQNNPSVHIENFQGVLGDVSGGNISQTMSMTIVPSQFSSLAQYLGSIGVEKEDIALLEKAIGQDPEPKSKDKFGERVSAWLGHMVVKAADGSWNIALGTASGLLAMAIAKFYGQ